MLKLIHKSDISVEMLQEIRIGKVINYFIKNINLGLKDFRNVMEASDSKTKEIMR